MKHIKTVLAVWGAVSGVLLIIAYAYFFFQFGFSTGDNNKIKINYASVSDISYVLNWARLGDDRIQSVAHSFESKRSLTGDHFDAFEIKTTGVSEKELQNKELWTRGDKLIGPLKEGVKFINMMVNSRETSWFPQGKLLTSNQIYIFSWSITFHHNHVTSAKIIFVKPSTDTVYYSSAKT